MKIIPKTLNVKKAATYAIVTNSIQILVVLVFAAYIVFGQGITVSQGLLSLMVVVFSLVVIWGALLDIREALSVRSELTKMDAMDASVKQMEELNCALRMQRHDFLNHLQVVYSLIEMQEYEEAGDYIEKVYGDTQAVSRVMRTQNPALNALLRVKIAECEQHNIVVTTDIGGAWKDMPCPAWEFCRVLSNLIDNARDALAAVTDRRLTIILHEEMHFFRFTVANNGPMIEKKNQERIFAAGVSAKGEGRGMGLYIVRKTLQGYGGDIAVQSDEKQTAFIGYVRRGAAGNG